MVTKKEERNNAYVRISVGSSEFYFCYAQWPAPELNSTNTSRFEFT